jgi:hypothetical protein
VAEVSSSGSCGDSGAGSPTTAESTPADVLRDRRDASAMRTEAACCGAAGCREAEDLWRIVVGDEIRILCRRHAVEYARRRA